MDTITTHTTGDGCTVHGHLFKTAPENHLSPDPRMRVFFAPRSSLSESEIASLLCFHRKEIETLTDKGTPRYLYVDVGSYPLVHSYITTKVPWEAKPPSADILLKPCTPSCVAVFFINRNTGGWMTTNYTYTISTDVA